jgi:hypothetical protein
MRHAQVYTRIHTQHGVGWTTATHDDVQMQFSDPMVRMVRIARMCPCLCIDCFFKLIFFICSFPSLTSMYTPCLVSALCRCLVSLPRVAAFVCVPSPSLSYQNTDKSSAQTLWKASMGSFYALSAVDIDDTKREFKEFDGKVSLVVNVASF